MRAETQQEHGEFTVVPFVGGDSDVGLGGGFIASWARLAPGHKPYLMRVEAAGTVMLQRDSGRFEVPYTDDYILVDFPHVIKDRLQIKLRFSHTREKTLKYYGIGNASEAGEDPSDPYFRYERSHPTAKIDAEYRLRQGLMLTWGVSYTQNWLTIAENSRVLEDVTSGSPTVRKLLGTPGERHGVLTYSYGVGLDTRDSHVSPHRGQYHTLRIDLAPGIAQSEMRYRWARGNANFRVFVPLGTKRLIFAARVLSDFLFGDPPFYELPRYDSTSAIGGANGVRGVPAQRFYGKIKILANTELRSELFDFRLLGKKNTFGLTGFFDTGRVFTDYEPHPELDGRGLGLKYGTGGGLRIAAGESFVLRFDVAWSKFANPVGAYLASGHVF